METNKPEPKIGAGHAHAMWRQGLAELRAAVYSDSSIAQPTEYGIYGTATPSEVMQEKAGDTIEPSILEKYANNVDRQVEVDRSGSREKERE